MSDPEKPLMEFPCDYLLKAIGTGPRDLEDIVMNVLQHHLDDIAGVRCRSRPSSKGNYLSVSVEFRAESRAQLDNIYRELNRHTRIRMCL
jgi:putative lipoic acid-binding regulatory protein